MIRVLVPLTITDAELDESLGVWEEALDHVLGSGEQVPPLPPDAEAAAD